MKKPQRPRRDHGARPTDEQLLEGARRVFGELGYHPATMTEIAEMAACTKPTLYAHFADKETLYRATLSREVRTLERRLFAAYAQTEARPLGEQLHNGIRAFFDYAAEEPDGFRLLFGKDSGGPVTPIRAQLIADIRTRVAELVRAFAASRGLRLTKSADLLSAMIVGVAIDGAHQSLLTTPADIPAASDLATAFVETAIRHLDRDRLTVIDQGEPQLPP